MATSNETFVVNLYRDLYYRSPTTSELSFYASRLESGFYTRSQVASQFLQSNEYTGGLESIIRLYKASFDRTPDFNGLMYWNGVMSKGASLSEIANIFFYSPEFVARYGANLGNAQFVQILYRNVLDREPDSGGAAYWNGILANGTNRGQVLASFAQSAELKQKLSQETKVVTAYALIAERSPYAEELSLLPASLDDILIKALSSVSSSLSWSSSTLLEAPLNDGSISNALTVTLAGGTFKGVAGTTLGTISNVPAGLVANLKKVSDTTASLTLNGKATNHGSSNSQSNLTVTFSAADFASGGLPLNATKNDFRVDFKDMFAYVRNGTLSIAIAPTTSLLIDLTTNTINLGSQIIIPIEGSMAEVTNVDLRGIPGSTTTISSGTSTKTTQTTTGTTTASVTFKGGAEDNNYFASPLGDTISSGGGNDTITLGTKSDVVILPSSSGSGLVTINEFKVGTGGDVLKVSGFLNKLNISNVNPIDTNLTPISPRAWVNGDLILVIGDLEEEDVVALFGSQLINPTTAAKLVLISADVSGDARIWYITNFSGSGASTISSSEVELVGILSDVNNLALAGFTIGNFG